MAKKASPARIHVEISDVTVSQAGTGRIEAAGRVAGGWCHGYGLTIGEAVNCLVTLVQKELGDEYTITVEGY